MGGGDRPWGVGIDGLIGDKCPDRLRVVLLCGENGVSRQAVRLRGGK